MQERRVLVAVPRPLRNDIMSSETAQRLEQMARVTWNEDGHNWSAEELADMLPGQEVLLASWGLAELSGKVLESADSLGLVAYAAGSVRYFVTDALFERGVAVTHAAGRIARSVAEFTLLLAMLGLRRPHEMDRAMKEGEAWPKVMGVQAYEIAGKKVGLLGMGYVGRLTAQLFRAVGAQVCCYDPYLPETTAQELGVVKMALDDLLRECQIVSVHLPSTEETREMLGERELALLQDGALFINTARTYVIDQEALRRELATGRFWAALDVYEQEPLPADDPLRELDNVLLTPHVAGRTVDSYRGLTETMVDEIERFFAGQPLRYRVDPPALQYMA